MQEEKKDLRVTVKFVEKHVTVTDEKTKEDKQMIEYYKGPDKRIYNPGEEAIVTRKHANWLEFHKFIEPLKKENKENKQAKGRQTK